MRYLKYSLLWALSGIVVALNPILQLVLRLQSPELYRFYNLADMIHKAYRIQDYKKAEDLALEYLKIAERFPKDWNYGNAIHTGHQVLGLIRLREGDVEKAKAHLLSAGKTPGSPQLDSFGPSMALARELLKRGEKEVVIQYLNLVAIFWTKDDMTDFHHLAVEHKELIKQWKSEVGKGRVPNHKNWG